MPVDAESDPETVYLTEIDAALLGDILGHPYELPTIREVAFLHEDRTQAELEQRLEVLIDRELVETVSFKHGPPRPELPELFVGITEFGRTVFSRRVPERVTDELKTTYAAVTKPDHIKQLERAPRPPR